MAAGAYGLGLDGTVPASLLTEVPEDWPVWTVACAAGSESASLLIAEKSATVPLQPGGRLDLDADARTIT